MTTACNVFVISMGGENDRRARFSARADTVMQWRFFDAHTGLSGDLEYDDRDFHKNYGRSLRPGELGCYSSHYHVWKTFLDSGDNQCVVLEDDVLVDWPGLEMFAAHDFQKEGLDYIRLYYKAPSKSLPLRQDFGRHTVIQLFDRAYGTQGYVLTRRGAETFLHALAKVDRPIDDAMDRYFAHGVPNLSVFPFLVLEESVPSAIGNERFASPPPAPSAAMRADRAAMRKALVRAYLRKALARFGGPK